MACLDSNHMNCPLDLHLYYNGTQECTNGHSWGPAVKDHYKIHYIHKGRGIFKVDSKTYHLMAGQGFLICPGIVSYYRADDEDPWSYSWVAFNGIHAEPCLKLANLTHQNPVFNYDKDLAISQCFKQMMEACNMGNSKSLRLESLLYLFMAILIDRVEDCSVHDKSIDMKAIYINNVTEYIQKNYSHSISIMEIANSIHLNRKYLSSLFKGIYGISLQQYIVNYRMDKACELLLNDHLSIGDISRSVGYEDPLLFSKMFKKTKGTSPKIFRNSKSSVPNYINEK